MINNNCLPSLTYGLEALRLTEKQVDSIVVYPCNAAFMKLLQSFHKHIIQQCQFYCSCLPINYLIDLYRPTVNFYDKLRGLSSNTASILYNLFSNEKRQIIADKNNLTCRPTDKYSDIKTN